LPQGLDKWREMDNAHRFDTLILVLAFVPIVFGAVFQGGYYTWEAYLMMLLALPAVTLFVTTRARHGWALAGGAVDRVLLAWLVVCAVSMVATVYFHATMVEFFKVLFCLILFYVVFNVTRHTAQLQIAVHLLLGIGVLIAGAGLLAYVGARSQLTGPFWTWFLAHGLTQNASVTSTLQYRNTFAAFLILPIFLSFTRALDVRKWWARLLYGALAGFFVVMLVLSQSRGGLLAFLITLLLFPVMLPRSQRLKGLLGILVVAAALAVTFWLRRDVFLPMLTSMTLRLKVLVDFAGGAKDVSLYARIVMIRDAWHILSNRPVLGFGGGTYQYVYAQYRSILFYAKFPHSILFQVLTDMGVIGGAVFVAMLASLLWRGLRMARKEQQTVFAGLLAGAFGNVLHAGVDFDWSLIVMPLFFFVTVALLLSRERREPGLRVDHVAIGYHKAALPVRLALGMLAVALVWGLVFSIFLGAVNNDMGTRAVARGDFPAAQYRFRNAVRLAPLAAEYQADLAEFLRTSILPATPEPEMMARDIQSGLERAIQLNPRFWQVHDALGTWYLSRQDPRAVGELLLSTQFNPLRSDGWFSLTLAYQAAGQDVQAQQAFERAMQLREQYGL
jgi:O-antigen ligase